MRSRYAVAALLSLVAVLLSYSLTEGLLFYLLLFIVALFFITYRSKIFEGLNHSSTFDSLYLNGRTVLTTDGYQNHMKLYFENMGFTSGNVNGYFY